MRQVPRYLRGSVHLVRIGLLVSALTSATTGSGALDQDFNRGIEPLLERYCFDCHGDGMDRGGLALDAYRSDPAFLRDTTTWLAVWRKLDSDLMPPARKPQPSEEDRRRLQDWIVRRVFALDPDRPEPGRVTLRRLNRTEYQNTIHDWLGIDYITDEHFPPDDTGYGFDNIGDVLSLSPLLMEKYLDAAQDITGELLERTRPRIPVQTMGGDRFREAAGERRTASQLAFAEAAAVSAKCSIADTGRYRLSVAYRITGSEEATTETATFRLLAGGRVLQEQSLGWDNRGTIRLTTETDFLPGEHTLSLHLIPGSPPLEGENHLALRVNQVRVEGPLDGSRLEYPREHRRFFPDGPPPEEPEQREAYARKILEPLAEQAFRRPAETATLDRLVGLAMAADRQQGVSFEEAVGQSLTAMLTSPRFLFRAENAPSSAGQDGLAQPLDEFALASRLSYFLWNSLPDEELFTLARTNGLRANLTAQVDRMLVDPRSDRFVESFVGQWLRTRDVTAVAPDPRRILGRKLYAEAGEFFNGRLREAMRQETLLLFADLLRHEGTLTDLLTTRETFLNEPLAKFYGVPGVTGREMRKVALPVETHRAGVLTHGSVLLVTSNPTRTSPVKRGLFVLDNFMGTPPPPPPPDIPDLEEAKQQAEQAVTMRELMAIHREQPLCASCHEQMDPVGLAFEHFNALGGYRERENGQPIRTAGTLITGETFEDLNDLAMILTTSRRRDLYRCVTEKLLTYALGRGLEYYDVPTVQGIVSQLEQQSGRLRTLVHAVVNSAPFQQQQTEPIREARASFEPDNS